MYESGWTNGTIAASEAKQELLKRLEALEARVAQLEKKDKYLKGRS